MKRLTKAQRVALEKWYIAYEKKQRKEYLIWKYIGWAIILYRGIFQIYWDVFGRKWNYSQRFPWPWWWRNR